MIRLTKKLLFAIEAVLDIAYNGGAAPVRSAEITEREGIRINPGDRIAQLVFTRVARPEFSIVSEFSEAGARQASGFGSSGIASACPDPAARRQS